MAGNHEDDTSGAKDYFDYFGARAGDPKNEYCSFDLGTPPGSGSAMRAPSPASFEVLGTVKTIAIGEGRRKPAGLKYWTEGNVREGSLGYACAVALDARGRAVGFGVYARHPLVFSAGGKGELEMSDVDIVLAPLSPIRALRSPRF